MNFSVADLLFTGTGLTDSSGKLPGQNGHSSNDFRVLLESILKKNTVSSAVSSSILPPTGLLQSLAPLLALGNLSIPGGDNSPRIDASSPDIFKDIDFSRISAGIPNVLNGTNGDPASDIQAILSALTPAESAPDREGEQLSGYLLWKLQVLEALNTISKSKNAFDISGTDGSLGNDASATGTGATRETMLIAAMMGDAEFELNTNAGSIRDNALYLPASLRVQGQDTAAAEVRIPLGSISQKSSATPARISLTILAAANENENTDGDTALMPVSALFSPEDIESLQRMTKQLTENAGRSAGDSPDTENSPEAAVMSFTLNPFGLDRMPRAKAETEIVRNVIRYLKSGAEVSGKDSGEKVTTVVLDFEKLREPGRTYLERSGEITKVTFPVKEMPVRERGGASPAESRKSGIDGLLAENDKILSGIAASDYSSVSIGGGDKPFEKSLSVTEVPSAAIETPVSSNAESVDIKHSSHVPSKIESNITGQATESPNSVTVEINIDEIRNSVRGSGTGNKISIPIQLLHYPSEPGDAPPIITVPEVSDAPAMHDSSPVNNVLPRNEGSPMADVQEPVTLPGMNAPVLLRTRNSGDIVQAVSLSIPLPESEDVPMAGDIRTGKSEESNEGSSLIVIENELTGEEIDRLGLNETLDSSGLDNRKLRTEKVIHLIEESFARETGLEGKARLILGPEQVRQLSMQASEGNINESFILAGKIIAADIPATESAADGNSEPTSAGKSLSAEDKGQTEIIQVETGEAEDSPMDVFVKIPRRLIQLLSLSKESAPAEVRLTPQSVEQDKSGQAAIGAQEGGDTETSAAIPRTLSGNEEKMTVRFFIPDTAVQISSKPGTAGLIKTTSPDNAIIPNGIQAQTEGDEEAGLKLESVNNEWDGHAPRFMKDRDTGTPDFGRSSTAAGRIQQVFTPPPSNVIPSGYESETGNEEISSGDEAELSSSGQPVEEVRRRQPSTPASAPLTNEHGILQSGAQAEKSVQQGNTGAGAAVPGESEGGNILFSGKSGGDSSKNEPGKEHGTFSAESGPKIQVSHNNPATKAFSETLNSGQQVAEQNFDPIIERVKFMKREGIHEMEMDLNPPELGKIQIRLNSDQSKLAGRISVDNHAVKALFDEHLPRLQEALSGNGIQVESLEVFVRNEQQPAQHELFGNTGNRKNGMRGGRNGDKMTVDGDMNPLQPRMRSLGYNSWEIVA